jgi:hypothetical protein
MTDQQTALSIATNAQTHAATGTARARRAMPRRRHGGAGIQPRPAERCPSCLRIDCRLRVKDRVPTGPLFPPCARGVFRRLPLLISLFTYQEPRTESYSYSHHCG